MQADVESELLKHVLLTDPTEIREEAVISSIRMVIEGCGMTSANLMYHFTTIITKVLFYEVVLSEAERYKVAYEGFKAKHPKDWALDSLKS